MYFFDKSNCQAFAPAVAGPAAGSYCRTMIRLEVYPTTSAAPTRQRRPFEIERSLAGLDQSLLVNSSPYSVAGSSRLYIQHVEGEVCLDGPGVVEGRLVIGVGPSVRTHVLPFSLSRTSEAASGAGRHTCSLSFSKPIRVEPGTSLVFWLARTNASGAWSGRLSAHGFLSSF